MSEEHNDVETLKMLLLEVAAPIGRRAMDVHPEPTLLSDEEVAAMSKVGNALLRALDKAREEKPS